MTHELAVGDHVISNTTGRKGVVKSMESVWVGTVTVTEYAWVDTGARLTRIHLDYIYLDDRPRKSGWSLIDTPDGEGK